MSHFLSVVAVAKGHNNDVLDFSVKRLTETNDWELYNNYYNYEELNNKLSIE